MDYQLIKNIRDGDEKAFELLFRKYYRRLCGFANKFLNDINESEEIVQEVFLNIWKNREHLVLEESLKPYLFKSVQNFCLNFIHHQNVIGHSFRIIEIAYKDSEPTGNNAYEELLASELNEKVKLAIENLPPECARIFKLSREEGLKYSEIAKRLDISVKTVETQISRALKKIKNELKDYLLIELFFLCMSIL